MIEKIKFNSKDIKDLILNPRKTSLIDRLTFKSFDLIGFLWDADFEEIKHPRVSSGPKAGQFTSSGGRVAGVKKLAKQVGLETKIYQARFKILNKRTTSDGGKEFTVQHSYLSAGIAKEMLSKVQEFYKDIGGEVTQDKYNLKVKIKLPANKNKQEQAIQNLPKILEKIENYSPSYSEIERHIQTAKPKKVERLGGGYSDTRKILFEDGSREVFKPHTGEGDRKMRHNISLGHQSAREAGAWELAKIVGLDDLVTPCVKREVTNEKGVVLAWQNGEIANNVKEEKRYDGVKDLVRAAIFDYIIGNEDRHSGNWLVDFSTDKDKGKLRLIDHGLSFPDEDDFEPTGKWDNHFFIQEVKKRSDNFLKVPELSSLKEAYVENSGAIVSSLEKIGLPEASIRGVVKRITDLDKISSWSDLNKKTRGYGQ